VAQGRSVGDVVDGQAVELAYRPTVEDLRAALRARSRLTFFGRNQKWLIALAVLLTAVAILLSVTVDRIALVVWPLPVGLVAGLTFDLTLPRLQARAFHKLAEPQGEFRGVVDDSGIRLTSDHGSATLGWQAYPRYIETDTVFVLLSQDKAALGVMVLPKRGVTAPADSDRLRALLDRHLTRA
jgi:hypothetical protein